MTTPVLNSSFAVTQTAPFVGDRVLSLDTGKYSGYGTVTRTNPKTVAVRLDSGLDVRFPYYLVAAAPDAPAAPAVPVTPFLHAGTVVSLTGKYAGLYVVIKGGNDRINVAKIGGDDGRYVRTSVASVKVQNLDPTLLAAATVTTVIKVGG